jgi:hypothetical protein
MLSMGDGTGGFGGAHDETVADAMVTIEACRDDATRRMMTTMGIQQRRAFTDWADILLWTPQTDSAEFASANGL